MMADIIGHVYMETDYSKFKYLIGNRNLTETRKKRIMNSIQKVGYVMNPIIVNERMEIIDGQGRHAACKELGLPIYYVIAKGAGADECINLNIGQTNWSARDYAEFYARLGNESYINLINLANEFPDYTFSHFVALCLGRAYSASGRTLAALKNGTLVFPDVQKTTDVLTFLEKNKTKLAYIKGERAVIYSLIAWIYRYCNADNDRLLDQLIKNADSVPPIARGNFAYHLEHAESVYNKRLPANKKIFFTNIFKQQEWKEHD